ncbi:transcription elongation factor GreA [Candidatus Beckwithbacteria bacterium]|nr:transcription elongation factor GreA [Candidatus Beckwithbacteria bacterium]
MYKPNLPKYELTKEGLTQRQKELEQLVKDREEAVVDLSKARAMGDLSENGYYKAARAKLSFIDSQIRKLQIILKYSVIIQHRDNNQVSLGSKVKISDGKHEREFEIVGKLEADPLQNRISNYSPIGKALLSKKVGDTILVNTPSGNIEYKILQIN